jgi:hypothetical protein
VTYERPDILRAEARELLRMLNTTLQELCATLDPPERMALTKWANEGTRLLGAEARPVLRGTVTSLGVRFRRRGLFDCLRTDDDPKGAA